MFRGSLLAALNHWIPDFPGNTLRQTEEFLGEALDDGEAYGSESGELTGNALDTASNRREIHTTSRRREIVHALLGVREIKTLLESIETLHCLGHLMFEL